MPKLAVWHTLLDLLSFSEFSICLSSAGHSFEGYCPMTIPPLLSPTSKAKYQLPAAAEIHSCNSSVLLPKDLSLLSKLPDNKVLLTANAKCLIQPRKRPRLQAVLQCRTSGSRLFCKPLVKNKGAQRRTTG